MVYRSCICKSTILNLYNQDDTQLSLMYAKYKQNLFMHIYQVRKKKKIIITRRASFELNYVSRKIAKENAN